MKFEMLRSYYMPLQALVSVGVSVLVMIGWITHDLPLVQIFSFSSPMQFNTALCFFLCGIALLLLEKHRNVAAAIAVVLIVFSSITALQYIADTNFGLDTLFIDPFTSVNTSHKGRMAPNTATVFILLGTALLLNAINIRLRTLAAFCAVLSGSLAAALGIVPLLGYLSGVEAANGWQNFARMSVHTAMLSALLGSGLVIHAWLKLEHAAMWMPLPVGIGLTVVAISMAYAVDSNEQTYLESLLQSESQHIANQTNRQLTELDQALIRITKRWQEAGGTPQVQWEKDAEAYIHGYSYLMLLARLDAQGRLLWQRTDSATPNISQLVSNFAADYPRYLTELAMHRHVIGIGPVSLTEGDMYFLHLYSLSHADTYDGIMVAGIRANLFFAKMVSTVAPQSLYLRVRDKNKVFYNTIPADIALDDRWLKTDRLKYNDIEWEVSVYPSAQMIANNTTPMPWVVLAVGLLTTFLATLSLSMVIRKQSDALKLKEGKTRLRAVFTHAADGITLIDGKGCIEEFNPACEALFGYSASEVKGQNVKILMPEPYHNEHDGYLTHHQNTGERKIIGIGREVQGKRKDGTVFDIDLRVSEVVLPGRKLYMGMFRDITERKRLELERSKLISMIEESSDFIGMADLNGNLQYHNRSAKIMVGLPEDFDMTALKITDMHPSSASKRMENHVIPEVFAKGIWKGENLLLHSNGREIPVLQTLLLHRDDTGSPLYLTTIMQDITERKAQEEALKASEEGLKLGWQGTGVGMWDWNVVTNHLSFSQRFKELLGYKPEEISDRYQEWESRVHPDDITETLAKLHLHLTDKSPYDIEYRMITKSGEWRWFKAQGQANWDENGKALRMAGSLDDVTERKRSEFIRQQLIDKLAESNTELERFAYIASHDLREPLRIVANFSTLLTKEYGEDMDEGGLEYLAHIKEASSRMHGMVGDLLEYARIGNEEMRYVTVDMNEELNHVLENLSAFIHEHRAIVTFDSLPKVQGNPVQLMRLLQNLMGNAIKFHSKGVAPQVHVGVEERAGAWRFFVRDNGIGMAKEYTQQIFEPFRQLHARNEYMGTGIGLAICKRIVEKHRGVLEVDSEPGKGSIFYCDIPKAISP